MIKQFKKPRLIDYGIILIIIGLILFFSGFSNFDLGQNIRFLNEKYNLNLVDSNKFKTQTGEQLMNNGFIQMYISVFLLILGGILFGIDRGKFEHDKTTRKNT